MVCKLVSITVFANYIIEFVLDDILNIPKILGYYASIEPENEAEYNYVSEIFESATLQKFNDVTISFQNNSLSQRDIKNLNEIFESLNEICKYHDGLHITDIMKLSLRICDVIECVKTILI